MPSYSYEPYYQQHHREQRVERRSNPRPDHRPRSAASSPPPRRNSDTVLRDAQMAAGDKTYHFSHRENRRGRFVRITEQTPTGYNTLIVPEEALEDFIGALSGVTA